MRPGLSDIERARLGPDDDPIARARPLRQLGRGRESCSRLPDRRATGRLTWSEVQRLSPRGRRDGIELRSARHLAGGGPDPVQGVTVVIGCRAATLMSRLTARISSGRAARLTLVENPIGVDSGRKKSS
jgi:hypothetical protein